MNLIISTSRRYHQFSNTLDTLIKYNPNIIDIVNNIYVLDDRSGWNEREKMEGYLVEKFKKKVNIITFNGEDNLDWIDKLDFVGRLCDDNEYTFFLEDDWESIASIDFKYHLEYLDKNTDIDTINFITDWDVQNQDVKDKFDINEFYWKCPFPGRWRHVEQIKNGVKYWHDVSFPNFSLSPSLFRSNVFKNNKFDRIANFELYYAADKNFKSLHIKDPKFIHAGFEESFISYTNKRKLNIGIQILAYNCADTFEELIKPWVELDGYENGYHDVDIKIWVGSGQFKIYEEMGCKNVNGPTIELLERLKDEGKIHHLFQPDKYHLLGDHTTRDKCVAWCKKEDIDLMIQVDADEFYGDQAKPYLDWIIFNKKYDIYNTILKGVTQEEGVFDDWERFSAAWIKRNGGISHYYLDQHWVYQGENNPDNKEEGNIEYRWTKTGTVPKEICNPLHYSWNNDLKTTGPEHIKEKIEYQKRYYADNKCGYEWDEENQQLIKVN